MGADPDVVVRLTGISKTFPGGDTGDVVANDGIDLELRRGEVHCLLGENGSGKSTLIGILGGLQQPDAGSIAIDGAPVALRSPAASISHGIGVVHQHATLVPSMSVLENLMLGDRGGLLLDRRGATARLVELSGSLGAELDPARRAGDLALGQRQQLEIVKALWGGSRGGARVLILDEPTSMLTPQGVERLLSDVRRLASEGLAVLFVTHKLHEAYLLGDAVTVLRRGRVVERIGSAEFAELDEARASERMLAAMFGSDSEDAGSSGSAVDPASSLRGDRRPARPAPGAPVILRLDGVGTADANAVTGSGGMPVREVSLEIRAGELLGVAGIDGHGQQHLAEAIAGQRPCSSGGVLIDGRRIERLGVRDRRHLGVRYVTDDRLDEGIVGSLSVALNLVLKQIGERPFWRRGRMDRGAVLAEARERIEAYDIRTPSAETRAGTLSGGNIQKLLLARELAHDPRVVVVNKPTYGLDLKTVERVRGILRDFAGRGGAGLIISTDLDELVELCGRIAVISGGRIVGVVENTGAADGDGARTAERIGELMAGSAAARPSGAGAPG